ncbi:MAG: hypothetical protein K8S00_09825 [Bacteroidales bacterium]|nr:hypothetical protein [Bacteroidales bacterium]
MKEYKFEVYIHEGNTWVMSVFARDLEEAKQKIKRLVPDVKIKSVIS